MVEPLVLWKNEGETPLACIDRARRDGKIAEGVKATYAGRLDPMASGVLLVLVGDAVHEKENFLRLDKEYVVEVLLGVSTDTGDILGKVVAAKEFVEGNISQAVGVCVGEFVEEYPKYSSKTVEGKPLFQYANEGEGVEMPQHTISISSIDMLDTRTLGKQELVDAVLARVAKIEGDFRQQDIIEKWSELARVSEIETFTLLTIRVTCGSGAYMRVLAEKIGRLLDVPALAYSIVRTRVGDFHI
jgi:tRNA pseudouridine(55) synthase